ncbi:hypothetical protein CLOM_g9357 [Closterium sp. NIES-68]|nr:hypothetical protein CLOM_g9357 [Closterium sp. NIES-68]
MLRNITFMSLPTQVPSPYHRDRPAIRLPPQQPSPRDWEALLHFADEKNLDSAGLVRKDFPSDIAKLLGLTSVAMPWNFLDGNLGTYVKYFSVLTNLQVVAMQYMYFSGSFPSVFINLPSLTALALRFNYLTGTVPTAITKIKSLDLYSNYLVGSIPTGTWSFCNSGSNCFASTSSCAGSQRAVTACAICGSTDGTGTLCGGTKLCVPDADTAIASKVNNYGAQVALYCSALYMNAGDAAALLNIKTAMGLTFTNWATTVPCRLEGNAAGANEWDRVSCTSDGRLYSINLDSMNLVRKSFPSGISNLTGLGMVTFRFNYLTGTVPTAITKFKSLDLYSNYLVGSIPTGTCTDGAGTLCGGRACIPDADARISGQRRLCSTSRQPWGSPSPTGPPRFLAASRAMLLALTSGTVNLDSAGLVRKSFPSDISKLTTLGLVTFRFNYLTGTVPTAITKFKSLDLYSNYLVGSIPTGTWVMPWNFIDGSLADYLKDFSKLTNLNTLALRFNYLTGTVPTAITKLKSLDLYSNYLVGSIPTGTWSFCNSGSNCFASTGSCAGSQRAVTAWMPWNFIDGNLETYLKDFSALTNLKTLAMQYMYFSGSFPSVLMNLPSLTSVRTHLWAAAALLNIKTAMGLTFSNWATTVPCRLEGNAAGANEWDRVSCTSDGRLYSIGSNCFASTGSCAGSQRAVTACAICGSTDGTGTLCGGTKPNLDSMNLVRKSFPSGISNLTGLGMVRTHLWAAAALLNIKTAMGLTFTNWATTVPCRLEGNAAGANEWDRVSCTSDGRLYSIGSNCFASTGSCAGSQRAVTACAICGSTDGTGTLCGGTKPCVPDADTAIASKVKNFGAQVALNCYTLYMDAGDATWTP